MEVVDSAVAEYEKVAPSITKYTAVGMFLGVLISALGVIIAALLDETIHDDDYILRTYDYPILAKIPNLLNVSNKQYSYYSDSKSKSNNKKST